MTRGDSHSRDVELSKIDRAFNAAISLLEIEYMYHKLEVRFYHAITKFMK